MRRVENAECGKCGVWKVRSVENAKCGKCGVWKMGSVESAESGKMFFKEREASLHFKMRRVGMVIGVGKVCAVQQSPCVVVPAYYTPIHVLDHDVVW